MGAAQFNPSVLNPLNFNDILVSYIKGTSEILTCMTTFFPHFYRMA